MTSKASDVAKALRAVAKPDRVSMLQSFFKTGPGEYAEGDLFLGVYVPDSRKVVNRFCDLPLAEIEILLGSKWHEERLAGVSILVLQFERGDVKTRRTLAKFYLAHSTQINNWDLVDSSAGSIIGGWLHNEGKDWTVLRKLARSENLWERRIAIIATRYYIQEGKLEPTLEIAEQLLGDKHDLIHKAVGWMLREAGKRDLAALEKFLDQHAARMPRTMLRYAIERFLPARRKYYLRGSRCSPL